MDNRIFLFDVDGTLTKPRCTIDDDFGFFFYDWSMDKKVVLVTGSDREKTLEQIGQLVDLFPCYQCAGNQLWIHGMLLYENQWEPSKFLLDELEDFLESSDFELRCGRHIEIRPGMVNFSVIGRACDMEQRKVYYDWDCVTGERKRIVDSINSRWSQLEASAGGQISIDIYPKGMGKGQIIPALKQSGEVIFFGDKTMPGGNDFTIARQLMKDRVHQVFGPMDTRRILEERYGH